MTEPVKIPDPPGYKRETPVIANPPGYVPEAKQPEPVHSPSRQGEYGPSPEIKQEIPISQVLPQAGRNLVNQAIAEVEGAYKQVTETPLEAAKKAAEGTVNIIKSGINFLGQPITIPAWGAAMGIQSLFGGTVGDDFKRDHIQSNIDLYSDIYNKYLKGWGGGEGDWGFTPEKGWANLKDTIANRPWAVAGDVAGSVSGPLGKFLPKAGRVVVPDIATATTRLKNMGINVDNLTPNQLEKMRVRMNEIGWDEPDVKTQKGGTDYGGAGGPSPSYVKDRAQAAEVERRRLLFEEAGITDPTESMLTGSQTQRHVEDRIRNGQEGGKAAEVINDADAQTFAQHNAQTDKVRASVTGSQTRMEPSQIGETITNRYNAADAAAEKVVTDKYTAAFDPAELAKVNAPTHVPEADVKGLTAAIHDRFHDPKKPFVATEETAPNAVKAIAAAEDFAKTGRAPVIGGDPMPPPGTSGVSWQSAEAMRQYLVGLRNSARGNAIDYSAMSRVLEAFDSQFGKNNPLLNDARAAHSERMKTFYPDEHRAGSDVVAAAEALAKSKNNGIEQFNKLFGSDFNKGEAIGAVNHLKGIFVNDPAAMAAMKEGALEKIFVNPKNYDNLSPQRTSTALDNALNGPQGEIYKALFTPDELAQLRRHGELSGIIGKHTMPTNPPRSGHEAVINARKEADERKAAAVIKGLTGAAGAGAGWFATHNPTWAGGAGLGAHTILGDTAGALLGKSAAERYRQMFSDPAAVRDAERRLPGGQTAPTLSATQQGALSGTGLAVTPDGQDQPLEITIRKARGGALRQLGRR